MWKDEITGSGIDMECTVRLEKESEYRAVENLVRDSFWNVYRPGAMEHYVLHCFRRNPIFITRQKMSPNSVSGGWDK